MFESIEDQIKIDEQKATTSRQRAVRLTLIILLSLVLFGALYFGIIFLSGS